MEWLGDVIWITELAGTAAFALAGALIGIEKEFDIFGVAVLGCTTATGGGIIRDLLLGITPPSMFENWIYALAACIVSLLAFLAAYITRSSEHKSKRRYMTLVDVVDAVGLGIFTVSGVSTAIAAGHGDNGFLAVFIGVITGVGGGIMRDLFAGNVPFIFVRRIYAVAAATGAILQFEMYSFGASENVSFLSGAALIILIRILAMVFKWNMPRIRHKDSVAAGEKK